METPQSTPSTCIEVLSFDKALKYTGRGNFLALCQMQIYADYVLTATLPLQVKNLDVPKIRIFGRIHDKPNNLRTIDGKFRVQEKWNYR